MAQDRRPFDDATEDRTLIFINYRTADSASAAALLHSELSARFGADSVFLDYESIRLGRDFRPELLDGVRDSAVLLVVVGDRWLNGEVGRRPIDDPADWVRKEIQHALHHGVPVLPVLFSGAKLTPDRLPTELAMLAHHQYYQIRRRQRSDIRALGDYLTRQIPQLAHRQARRRSLPDGAIAGSRPPGLMGLPPAVSTFTGREGELARLSAALNPEEPGEPAGSATTVIAGMAGAGKTALALIAAHEAWQAGWFPGGMLMFDMLGYEAGDRRVRPEAALAGVLADLGVSGEHLPADSAARERLWRTMLADRFAAGNRMLIIVDNVSSSAQVRPLLPGVGSHRVLVTSRHTLTDIDAAVLKLDVLSSHEAAELLRKQLVAADASDNRGSAQAAEAQQIAQLCGGLPLAVRIAGALLAADRTQSLAELAGTLSDDRRRLEELHYDGSLAVRSAFDLSYRRLDRPDARLFRLLAVHPGREFPAKLADVVTGEKCHHGLRRLHRANLIEPGGVHGRWLMHDLVRLYAEQLAVNDPERTAVLARIAEYYLALFGRLLHHNDPAARSAVSEQLASIDRDIPTVVAVVTQAYEAGLDDEVVRLAETMSTYFDLRKSWEAWIRVDQVALRSAARIGEADAANRIRLSLAVAYRDLGRFDEALQCCDRALDHFRRWGDERREAEALNNRAVVLRKCVRLAEALADLDAALTVWRGLGDALGQARALNNLGLVHMDTGTYRDALDCFDRALAVLPQTKHERREAKVQHNYGVACLRLGRFTESADRLRRAIALRHESGDRYRAAKSRTMLGTVLVETGQPQKASEQWRQALDVFREVGDQGAAERVRTQLEQIA
ncbi:tetratricopeptide repeat protein [Amycolatopsis sp. NPDC051061]|uniref:tetratricopeptide repeat protein n=1 Tax=Amycolatopsis sp. NPDC051061 TaxID=3155042 RepID=UPI003412BAF1